MPRMWSAWAVVALVLAAALSGGARAEEPAAPPKLPPVWKTLEGRAPVAAISPDGKFVAAYDDQTSTHEVIVYRRDTGKEHCRVPRSAMHFLAFIAGGKQLVTLAGRHPNRDVSILEAVVTSVDTGKRLRSFDLFPLPQATSGAGSKFAVSDKTLIVSEWRKPMQAFDLATGKLLGDFDHKGHQPRHLALSPDGKLLLTAGYPRDTRLRLWDARKRTLLRELDANAGTPWAVAVSADGRWGASAAPDQGQRYLWVFDLATGKLKAKARPLLHSFTALSFSPDGRTLYAAGGGSRHGLAVWDWRDSKEVRGGLPPNLIEWAADSDSKKWDPGSLLALGVSDDGVLLTTSGRNGGDLRLWSDPSFLARGRDNPEPPKKTSKPKKK